MAIKSGLGAIGIMLLTSIHHAYGAVIYGTPWRFHVIHFAACVILGLVVALALFHKGSRSSIGSISLLLFIGLVVVFPIGWIGLFEGGYSHLLKNALYFLGASPELMSTLFPPPYYEIPNNLFFEATGVLQFIAAICLIRPTFGLWVVRHRVRSKRTT